MATDTPYDGIDLQVRTPCVCNLDHPWEPPTPQEVQARTDPRAPEKRAARTGSR